MSKYGVLSVLAVAGIIGFSGMAQADLNDGLVAYYPFNGNADDASGNGNDGIVDGAILSEDRFGNPNSAYIFDGIDVWIYTQSVDQALTEKTMSAWVKLNDVSQQGGGVVSLETPEADPNFDSIVYNEQGTGWGFGSDYFRRTDEWSGYCEKSSQWVHITATYQDYQYKLYRNGDLILETTSFSAYNFPDTNRILIGRRHTPRSDNTFLNAQIDEVRIYNRALSESEIQELYNESDCDCPDACTQEELDAKYDEGYQDGIDTCEGCTQSQLNEQYEAGKQYCIDYPEECGISTNGGYTQAELNAKYQEGCNDCSDGTTMPATISPELNMHIPELQYNTAFGTMDLWADFEFVGESNGDMLWKLSNFGEQ